MVADLRRTLAERGIELRRYEPGEQRAPCPWCDRGPRDDALAVRIDQDGAAWFCHRCGEKGGARCADSGAAPRRRAPTPEPERHETLSDWGRALWQESRTMMRDCPAGRYLIRRGCRIPPKYGDLRWHPKLHDPMSGYTGPALIGLVTDALTGEAINLHRTWLAQDGSDKAPIHKPRRLLKGHRSRGVIRLWPDDEITMGLVLGEGVETCLAAARARLGPVWSTISAGNLACFLVLPGLEGLTILVDHDKPDKHGRKAGLLAAIELRDRYVQAGFDPERDILVVCPDQEDRDVADFAVEDAP